MKKLIQNTKYLNHIDVYNLAAKHALRPERPFGGALSVALPILVLALPQWLCGSF